ncbi:Restriction of telomere capping protein 4 [Maudiozyma exigua]|uniref:Restriction of telomere capping protein 4 n=1 Tax=Maudiozyma exigua TaxID=34358 RepID=A0A9P7B9Z7_MAUEX|nr:Restriction of telomere capping protein 4 [Kazachstania exigua]
MAVKRNRQSHVSKFNAGNDPNLAAVKLGGRMSPKTTKLQDPYKREDSEEELSNDTFDGDLTSDDEKDKKKQRMIDDLNTDIMKTLEAEKSQTVKVPFSDISDDSSTEESKILIDSVPDIDMDLPKYKPDSPIKKVILDSDDEDDNQKDSNSLDNKIKKNLKAIKKIRNGLNSTMTPEAAENYKTRITKKYKLPPIISLNEIGNKCGPFLNTALDILNGKVQSGYYSRAKQMSKESKVSYLSTNEMRRLDLTYFFAGYYGLMRQYLVGQMIVNEFRDKLERSKSPVLRWWGTEDFSSYVLAPDVLTELCISEMGLKPGKEEDEVDVKERVFSLFQDTKDFGLKIADQVLE